jgi:hypothetical protein
LLLDVKSPNAHDKQACHLCEAQKETGKDARLPRCGKARRSGSVAQAMKMRRGVLRIVKRSQREQQGCEWETANHRTESITDNSVPLLYTKKGILSISFFVQGCCCLSTVQQ